MEELNSIKGNIIRYSEDSRENSITDILSKRFHEDSDLETDFDKMHNPFLLNDMEKAVKRLKKAHKN
jgi:macrodomain Ter protein organizer (MatP/YcbG family)